MFYLHHHYLFITSVNKHLCFTNTDGTLMYFTLEEKPPWNMREEETPMMQKFLVHVLQGQLLVDGKKVSLPQKGELKPPQNLSH